ncbi:hypothetical protein OGAPHI_001100 [Ogataea philodendri]|uniref:Ubiquitin-related modifier 1 n=1 Tax=Ogataea philodendri TaxID=1378263 RepID=A0A9P8PFG8_9ASCO|nr:uncharacterized protein OGAPHI_001100 [Ogataea philodendri]KAH3670585.1 hypothetical protein OGAPHI_001100 [Ogataea philodendri]
MVSLCLGSSLVRLLTNLVHSVASCKVCSFDKPNTTLRKQSEVAKYRWIVARLAPVRDSIVRLISSGRHGERTWIDTSSGAVSTQNRVKSKSICEAEGNATSISLNPISTSFLKYTFFSSTDMGSGRDWFPSLRSVESQRGGFSNVLSGHCLLGSFKGTNFLYFFDGFESIFQSVTDDEIFFKLGFLPCGETSLHSKIFFSSTMPSVNVKVEFFQCAVSTEGNPTIKDLMYHITKTLLVDQKDYDVFVEDDTIRPGILVLINDTDWELEGEDEYELQDGDVIAFTSTLHGG